MLRNKYLYFTFKNVCSSKYNLFITSKEGDQKLIASPDKTINFTTPEYQNNTYYLGTTKKQKTFKKSLAADGLTWQQAQEIFLWLEVGSKGFLSFDYDPFWGWDVVITNIGEVTYHELSDGTFVVEFDIEWKTYGDWHARSTISASLLVSPEETKIYLDAEKSSEEIKTMLENLTWEAPINAQGEALTLMEFVDSSNIKIYSMQVYRINRGGDNYRIFIRDKINENSIYLFNYGTYYHDTIEPIIKISPAAYIKTINQYVHWKDFILIEPFKFKFYNTIANKYGIPEIIMNEDKNSTENKKNYDFLGVSDSHSFIDIMFSVPPAESSDNNEAQETKFSIKEDNDIILSYNIKRPTENEDNYYYYGKYGFVIDNQTNEIIERTNKIIDSYQTSRIFEINNSTPIKLNLNTDIKLEDKYWLDYKYYSQLENDFYLVVTKLKEEENYESTYNALGNIQYGNTYDTEISIIRFYNKNDEDNKNNMPTISNDGKWIEIWADDSTIWNSIQNPSASLYACNFHRYQIEAPGEFTITVDKHNNNNDNI